jgi:hypothetical protein
MGRVMGCTPHGRIGYCWQCAAVERDARDAMMAAYDEMQKDIADPGAFDPRSPMALSRARIAALESENAALRAALETLRSFASDMAEGDCEYGDNCPTFGTRHGSCDPCRARAALDATKGRGE